MLNYLEEHNSRELKTYFDSQIQPLLSTTTQFLHRHHIGNLEYKKKKSSTTRLLLGNDLEHVMN